MLFFGYVMNVRGLDRFGGDKSPWSFPCYTVRHAQDSAGTVEPAPGLGRFILCAGVAGAAVLSLYPTIL
jgi:hypothetical protein